MIRRILLVAAAAVAVVLVPSVAMAANYNAPGYSSSVSDSTPTVGHPITVTVNGGLANAGKMITLVITSDNSTMSLTRRANANGVVKFTFKLSAAGTYQVEAKNAAGALVSSQTLSVSSQNASAFPAAPDKNKGGMHPNTGFDGLPLALGGGVLVLAGTGAVVVAKRRRSA